MTRCVVCETILVGRQRRFCCRQCKNDHGNNRLQTYAAQQRRGRRRKLELIRIMGGRCESCSYARNHAALEMHHRDPDDKKFQLDLRSLSNRRWSAILKEAKKCTLVCSNCQKELHNPECEL